MKRKPLQQLSLIAVLRDLTELSDDTFEFLLKEVQGNKAFNTERNRIAQISSNTGLDGDSLSLLLSALNFIYSEVHSDENPVNINPELMNDILDNLENNNSSDEKLTEQERKILLDRLPRIIERRPSTDKFRKAERLKAGFLPAATSFSTFVDLRPLLSEDHLSIEELIPLIQFRIRTDSSNPEMRNFVFQMDVATLEALKEAISKVEQKIATVTQSDWTKHLVSGI